MPQMSNEIDNSKLLYDEKIELLIDNYFGENEFEKIFKYALNIIYKKRVYYYLSKNYLSINI